MPQPVLLLELNELSPVLMDRFIAAGDLPAFRRLRSESSVFLTDAGETGARLQPWVQWPTVHTGVDAATHGLLELGESGRLAVPTIADVVAGARGSSWLCGPMNVVPTAPVRGAFLPDPWSVGVQPAPIALEPFNRFVRAHVQEHTRESMPIRRSDAVAFVRFMATHGLSAATAGLLSRQLLDERRGRIGRWRRAVLLDRLQWDVFRWYHERIRPRFASFFSNSTAHFQHLYWSDMEPEAFGRDPAPGGRDETAAILHGYRSMDRLVSQALSWAGDRVTVVFCTALSQEANVDGLDERAGLHRPRDLASFAGSLGLAGVRDASPVMAEQFRLYFDDAAAAMAAAARLRRVTVDGDAVFAADDEGAELFVGCRLFSPLPAGSTMHVEGHDPIPFHDTLYWSESPRSGTHHPDGMLWIRTGEHRDLTGERVPLTAVAPTILGLLGLDAPATMTMPALTVPRRTVAV